MKILHVIDALQLGGAENLLCNTIAELCNDEHLVVTVFGDNNLSLLPKNTKHKTLGAKSKAGLFLKLPAYRKLLQEFAPDLVHAHLYFATLLAKAGTPSRTPLLFTQHFEFSKNISKAYYAWADRLFSNKKQTCIAVSNVVLQDYLKLTRFNGRTTVLGIYIPDRYFELSQKKKTRSDEQVFRVIALGNIKPIKNQRYLLDAFAQMKDLPVRCDVYGEGEEREALEKEARAKGIPVYFKGGIADSATVLPSYDAYIMPSLSEGFPLALFEAMAACLPAIVSDIPVFHELLGECGDYVSLQNPASVRTVLLKYLAKPQLLSQRGEALHKLSAEKASRKIYLQRLRTIYTEAIGRFSEN